MENKKLSESLMHLSDAIEHLAMLIAAQPKLDNIDDAKTFDLIVKKFIDTSGSLDHTKQVHNVDKVVRKHQKGFLQDWLADRSIYIGSYVDTLRVDQKLYEISDFLADHYNHLEPFYTQLKRHQNLKKDFKSQSQKKSIKYIRKWCNLLHRNKIIDSFQCIDDADVEIDIAELHTATYFINGYWLELLIRRELAMIFKQNIDNIRTFDILAQVEIAKPDQTNSELDLLIMIDEKVYWFECKSGHIGSYYKRFAEHRELLGLPTEQSFVVVPQMELNQAKKVMQNCGMHLLYGTNLSNQLQQYIFDDAR